MSGNRPRNQFSQLCQWGTADKRVATGMLTHNTAAHRSMVAILPSQASQAKQAVA